MKALVNRRHLIPCAVLATAAAVAPAATTTIDFENLANNTVVTTQYEGVTFSAQPQSCAGTPPVNLIIRTPTGGTSSGTKGLGITTGCPDFSSDYIRIVFDELQQEVTFTVGDTPGTYQVRAYTAAGGVAVATQNIVVGGAGFVGVHRLVRVASASVNIRRIEIADTVGDFETIDDLTFACPDITPPEVEISSPTFETCVCEDSVTIRGRSCDPEGFDHDVLEYLPVNAAAGTAWVQAGSFTAAQCSANGVLYTWNAAALADGCYYLRITAFNDCGDTASAVTVVCMDRSTDAPTVRSPAGGSILGGSVCVDGTVWEGVNSGCLDHYTVNYRPSAGGAWNPVDPLHATYESPVVNDPLASWNTAALADGNWQLRVRATNNCSVDSSDVIRNLVIDNTAPIAVIGEPVNCQQVSGMVTIKGKVSDAHLGQWVLQYTGGDAEGWVTPPIAQGNAAVNGVLGMWDTTGLRRCAYTLRLLATDTSVVSCVSGRHNQTEHLISVYVGELGHFDYDSDGDVDAEDHAVFQRCHSGPEIPAAPECLD